MAVKKQLSTEKHANVRSADRELRKLSKTDQLREFYRNLYGEDPTLNSLSNTHLKKKIRQVKIHISDYVERNFIQGDPPTSTSLLRKRIKKIGSFSLQRAKNSGFAALLIKL